jgi:dihydroorotate dehydrogenase electron transfer subunit
MTINERMGNSTSVRVSEVIQENKDSVTLMFQHEVEDLDIRAGQFLMIWIPGIDEVPMSVSFWEPPVIGVSVLPIGEATEALASCKVGDWIGIRGPFGTSYSRTVDRALVVGGGIGAAPLRPLVYELLVRKAEVTLLLAARTESSLLYLQEFSSLEDNGFHLEVATDDGSRGFKSLATEAAQRLIETNNYDVIYTCGPELMMHGLYRLAQESGIPLEASLERFMKCGCGICGTCALDPTGALVCLDGPVFTGEQLAEISDFGNYDRDEVGRKKKC